MKKFDVVIGNPPYQDSSHKEKKNTLWRKWLDFMNTIVNDGGFFSLIIPSSWMGSPPILKEYFFNEGKQRIKYNIRYINRDECKKYFSNVGSTFSYFIIEKTEYKNKTTIISKNINGEFDLNKDINLNNCIYNVFPRDLSKCGLSILKKTIGDDIKKLGIINNTYNHSTHKEKWRLNRSEEFCYPIQNTPHKLYWYNYPHPHQDKKKLLIPTSTYYRKQMISNYGTTQSFCYLLIDDDLNEDIVINNVNNKLFDYLNECFRYANWNSVNLLRKLPKIPLRKKLTDDDIFDIFDLTCDEIKHINKLIKWR